VTVSYTKNETKTCKHCGKDFMRRMAGGALESVGRFRKRVYCDKLCDIADKSKYIPKECPGCRQVMLRRLYGYNRESIAAYNKRQYCNNICAGVHREEIRRNRRSWRCEAVPSSEGARS
jgi:hypothetical protein